MLLRMNRPWSRPLALLASLSLALLLTTEYAGGSVVSIEPERMYVGVNRPLVVEVALPGVEAAPDVADANGGGDPEGPPDASPAPAPDVAIALIDPKTAKEVDRAPAATGAVDLAALFPVLWTTRTPRVLVAQVVVDGEAVGAPCVLQPLLTPRRADDALTSRVSQAVREGNASFLRQLLSLAPAVRDDLAQQIVLDDATSEPVYSGLRCYVDRQVVLETSAGDLTLALAPEHAPNSAFWFRHLAQHGAYDGVVFHRVIAEDLDGHPYLVQSGDPTATGLGGVGMQIDFEGSTLAHDYGVVSMARSPDDPNSASSQFFICLSKEACEGLDGLYAPFAAVVSGVETLDAIAASPVGPNDPDDPASRHERPLSPVEIERVRLVPAPPFSQRPPRIERPRESAVER